MGCNYYKMFPQFKQAMKKKGLFCDIPEEDFITEVAVWFGFSQDTARKWVVCFHKARYIKYRQHIDEMSGASCGWSVDFV